MHVFPVRVSLLLSLFMLNVCRCFFINSSRPYSREENASFGTSQKSNDVYNVTVDCGDHSALRGVVYQCQEDLRQLTEYGYPWRPHGREIDTTTNSNVTQRNITLRDALDSLNNLCRVHDRRRACLEESGVQDYCLGTAKYNLYQWDFQFICHQRKRDGNLARSLQCLHDKRVLVM